MDNKRSGGTKRSKEKDLGFFFLVVSMFDARG